jgi:hypothetical protein
MCPVSGSARGVFCKRGSVNVRFAPKATEALRSPHQRLANLPRCSSKHEILRRQRAGDPILEAHESNRIGSCMDDGASERCRSCAATAAQSTAFLLAKDIQGAHTRPPRIAFACPRRYQLRDCPHKRCVAVASQHLRALQMISTLKK